MGESDRVGGCGDREGQAVISPASNDEVDTSMASFQASFILAIINKQCNLFITREPCKR